MFVKRYMVNGDEANINDGALAKKAVEFKTDEKNLYDALVKMKNTPVKKYVKAMGIKYSALTKLKQ